MRLAGVFARVEWHSVLEILRSCYTLLCRNKERHFESAFLEIQSLVPVDTSIMLHMDNIPNPATGACPIHVYGSDGSFFLGQEDVLESEKILARIGIAYTLWEEWLGMQLGSELPDYTDAEIAAHCLVEMTSLGFRRSVVCRRIAATRHRFASTDNSNCDEGYLGFE